MKNSLKTYGKVLMCTLIIGFTSCSKDEQFPDETNIETTQDLTNTADPQVTSGEQESEARAGFALKNIQRFFSGGSLTVHTYRYGNLGTGIGNYEGIAFNTWISTNGTAFNTGAFNKGYFLIHPQNRDFIITVSASEAAGLRNAGWRDLTNKLILFQKYNSVGTAPLYRFYSSQNSDHLFTKNYSEGANAGYQYEGVVGYVR